MNQRRWRTSSKRRLIFTLHDTVTTCLNTSDLLRRTQRYLSAQYHRFLSMFLPEQSHSKLWITLSSLRFRYCVSAKRHLWERPTHAWTAKGVTLFHLMLISLWEALFKMVRNGTARLFPVSLTGFVLNVSEVCDRTRPCEFIKLSFFIRNQDRGAMHQWFPCCCW